MSKIVAIHQPNFFPWLGYFHKIFNCDEFILLDDVQFSKKGGTWSNRVKLFVAGESRWVTAPIRRSYHGMANVNEIEWNDEQPWREKMLKTLETNYRQAPFFFETMDIYEPLIRNTENNLARYNGTAIINIAQLLGVKREKIHWSSSYGIKTYSTNRLIELTRAVGGDTYMPGGGSEGYQENNNFIEEGINLNYQNFKHPQYKQSKATEFVSGLSAIDAFMNVGVNEMRIIFNSK